MRRAEKCRWLKKRSIFATLILSYMALMAISILLVGASYYRLYDDAREHAEGVIVAHLKQASSITDSYVERVQQTLLALCTNVHVSAFSNAHHPLDGADYYRLWQVVQTVSGQASSNPLLENMYIYYYGIDSVVDASTRIDAREYYDLNLKFQNQTYEQWREFLGRTGYFNAFEVLEAQNGARYLPFSMALPLGVSGRSTVVGYMNLEDVEALFGGIGAASEYSVLIAQDGEALLTLGDATARGEWIADSGAFRFGGDAGGNYLQLAVEGQGRWTYYCAFEADAYFAMFESTRRFIVQMLIMELIGGVICAVLLALNSYSPLRRLMRVLGSARRADDGAKNDIQRMLDAATGLIDDNSSLNARLRQQEPLLRAGLIQQLLSGDGSVSRSILAQSGIALERESSCVAIVGAGDAMTGEERTVFYFTLCSALGEWLEQRRAGNALVFAPDRVVALINASEGDIAALTDSMIEYIGSSLRFAPIAGVSSPVHSLADMHVARAQAEEAFNYAYAWRKEGITRYDELSHELRAYILTLAQEQELVMALQSGDVRRIDEMIRRLFCDARNEPLIHIRMLAYGVITICMRTLAEWKTPSPLLDELDELGARIDMYASPDDLMDALSRMAASIARESGKLHDGSYTAIVRRTIDIINARYADAALSQTSVAQELQLNPSYLSHAFKQQAGASFVDYLNNTRLDHACTYLRMTAMSIQLISERCGYTSAGYFNRVFKKKFGITPGQYREGLSNPPQMPAESGAPARRDSN